tara:strand:- start:223 stop:363 length:141 start_codon:yes stop_codon:yes gene_type:complete
LPIIVIENFDGYGDRFISTLGKDIGRYRSIDGSIRMEIDRGRDRHG